MTKSPAALTFVPLVLLASCAANPNYATPEKTVATYAANAHVLKSSIDIPAWNFTWNALSQSSQQWFDENWEAICDRPAYREACGNQSNPEKARMVAFGGAISRRGPKKGCVVANVVEDGDTAEVTVKGWPETIYLVKEGREWKIDWLFGVEEMASSRW